MSRRTVNVTVLPSWAASDTIIVYRGQENAPSLAASSSVKRVARVPVGSRAAGSVISIDFDYTASDICGTLPIGVSVADAAGNEDSPTEAVMPLSDPPRPPGRPDVAATANPGEARLTWLPSPDL